MENIKEFNTDIFKLFDDHWALLTAGTPEHYNTMHDHQLGQPWHHLGTTRCRPSDCNGVCETKPLHL